MHYIAHSRQYGDVGGEFMVMTVIVEHPVLPFAKGEWRMEPRGSVGVALSEARLRCAMSIEDVAAATRVPVRYLSAIEAERFDVIPGRVYVRGFAQAFARAVGLCERWAAEAIAVAIAEKPVSTTA